MPTTTVQYLREQEAADRQPEATLTLVRLAQAGDRDAADRLLRAHTGIVKSIIAVRPGDRCGRTDDELLADGMQGLWRAIRTYDRSRGGAFSTWAVWCLRGALTPIHSQRRFYRSERPDFDCERFAVPDAPVPDAPVRDAARTLSSLPVWAARALRAAYALDGGDGGARGAAVELGLPPAQAGLVVAAALELARRAAGR